MPKAHGRVKKRKEEGALIITSLIDVFTILVVFLLKNFSAEGNLVSNAENLTLPYSSSSKDVKEVNLQIAITEDMILVDDKPVVPSEDMKRITNENPDPTIPKLTEVLDAKHAMEEEMVRLGASNKFEGKVVIQIDKNIPFDYLFKVINTAAKSGYSNIKLAVIKREEG
jgi:biopolymer transport protein ExbD